MTFIKLLEAGLSVGPWRLSRSQDSTQISVPGSFSLGSNCWCFLPFSFPILWRGPGRKACSLSASVGSGVSTGLLGKGLTPVFRSKVHKPHATPPLSSSRGRSRRSLSSPSLPLFLSILASSRAKKKSPKRSTTPSGGQKHLTFLCLTRGDSIDSQIPSESPSHTPTPVTEFLCQRVNSRVFEPQRQLFSSSGLLSAHLFLGSWSLRKTPRKSRHRPYSRRSPPADAEHAGAGSAITAHCGVVVAVSERLEAPAFSAWWVGCSAGENGSADTGNHASIHTAPTRGGEQTRKW